MQFSFWSFLSLVVWSMSWLYRPNWFKNKSFRCYPSSLCTMFSKKPTQESVNLSSNSKPEPTEKNSTIKPHKIGFPRQKFALSHDTQALDNWFLSPLTLFPISFTRTFYIFSNNFRRRYETHMNSHRRKYKIFHYLSWYVITLSWIVSSCGEKFSTILFHNWKVHGETN